MEINTHETSNGVALDVAGRLVAGGPEFAFSSAIRRAIDAGHRAIVVNLAFVSTVDAAGIGAIISTVVRARERGVSLVFERATPRVHTLLTVTGVWRELNAPRQVRPASSPSVNRAARRGLVETWG
jgi:anti-anti-sigma factor